MTDTYRPLPGSGVASATAGDPGPSFTPWPPPNTSPAPPAPAEPRVPPLAAPDPTASPDTAVAEPVPPPGEPEQPERSDEDRFQPVGWVYVLIAVLIVALLGFLWWRSRGSGDDASEPPPTIAPTTTAGAPVSTGVVVTNPDGSPVTNPDGTPVLTSAPPLTNPDGTPSVTPGPAATNPDGTPSVTPGPAATNPDGTPAVTLGPGATTVPGGVPIAPPATAPGATTGPAPPAQSLPPLTTRSLRLAQGMATALADGDWAEVRRMSPTDTRTVAALERDYAGLESSTIVPAREATLSSGLVDLRLGLVAHESRDTGPQTSLFCVHWIVDPLAGTVQRLDAVRLRTVGGTIPPAQVATELATTCATIELR